VVSGHEVVRALAKVGFSEVSQRGSHLKLRSQEGRTVIVPMHRELARGTLRSILRQADLTVEAFMDLL
jgi:predicted RNA binding protein YcfA (HicA-like mRNA interferase family)